MRIDKASGGMFQNVKDITQNTIDNMGMTRVTNIL